MTLHVRSTLPAFPSPPPHRGWQRSEHCPQSFAPRITRQHVWVGTPGHHGARSGSWSPYSILLHRPSEMLQEYACSLPGHRRLEAGARHERTLLGVGCSRLFGAGWAPHSASHPASRPPPALPCLLLRPRTPAQTTPAAPDETRPPALVPRPYPHAPRHPLDWAASHGRRHMPLRGPAAPPHPSWDSHRTPRKDHPPAWGWPARDLSGEMALTRVSGCHWRGGCRTLPWDTGTPHGSRRRHGPQHGPGGRPPLGRPWGTCATGGLWRCQRPALRRRAAGCHKRLAWSSLAPWTASHPAAVRPPRVWGASTEPPTLVSQGGQGSLAPCQAPEAERPGQAGRPPGDAHMSSGVFLPGRSPDRWR